MKKNKAILPSISIILPLVLSLLCFRIAGAATCDTSAGFFCNPLNTGGEGTDTFADIIILAVQVLLSFIGLFALLFLIIGGIRYIVAAGNQDAMSQAKHTITASITGLILAVMAYGIVIAMEEALRIRN